MYHPEGPHRPMGNQDHFEEEEENEVPDEPSTGWSWVKTPLLGLTNTILNLTTVPAQDNVFISWAHSYAKFHNSSNCWICGSVPLSVMDRLPWCVSPLHYGDFIPLCSFLKQQKGTFLSLTNHNLSLLSWCKNKPSMSQGHRVTFKMNTSLIEITKAYTSYMKLKEEKGSLTKGGQASCTLSNTTRSGMNISG